MKYKTIICGIPYDIIEREPNLRSDENLGRGDCKHATITMDGSMPQAVKDATLVHEWMHQVYECNGVAHEEQHVSVMATELYRQGFRIKVAEVAK